MLHERHASLYGERGTEREQERENGKQFEPFNPFFALAAFKVFLVECSQFFYCHS